MERYRIPRSLLVFVFIISWLASWLPASAGTSQSQPDRFATREEGIVAYEVPTESELTLADTIGLEVTAAVSRTENNNVAISYSGSWGSWAFTQASVGNVNCSATAGNTATFTFTGEWVGVGFMGGTNAGKVEIFLDSISQGIFDLYRNGFDPVSLYFSNLTNTSHTILITVLADHNPLSSGNQVQLDYFDYWDGVALPEGVFEQDSARVFLSSGWGTENNAAASGGSYMNALLATAWFPFTGDSVTFQAIAFSSGGSVGVFVDGQRVTNLNLYNNATASRTISLTGLGVGAHVLQVSTYRGNGTIDAFSTPGVEPFFTPASVGSYHRYEEDDPAIAYNDLPFSITKSSWDMVASTGIPDASGMAVAISDQAGDTATLTFEGRWVGVGFHKYQGGGQAEIFLDGISQGIVGLYSAQNDVLALQFDNLAAGDHTITVSVLGLPDSPGLQANVRLDYFEEWDGQELPDDIANASLVNPDQRISLGGLLSLEEDFNAMQGDYVATSNTTNIWYAFTGDSFAFYPFSRQLSPATVEVYVDDVLVEYGGFHLPLLTATAYLPIYRVWARYSRRPGERGQ